MSIPADQSRDGYSALADHFNNYGHYLSSGNSPPNPYDLYNDVTFEDLLAYVKVNNNESADFSIGAGIESVNQFVGVERELVMTEYTKNAIYLSAISEARRESDFLVQSGSFFYGLLKGAPSNGSQC